MRKQKQTNQSKIKRTHGRKGAKEKSQETHKDAEGHAQSQAGKPHKNANPETIEYTQSI